MKNRTLGMWCVGLALAALLEVGLGLATAPPAPATTAASQDLAGNLPATNPPPLDATDQMLANAPGQVVSTPTTPPPDINVSGPAAEVIKLARAGLDESVLLAFVTNSTSTFNLNSDQIIYLNDIGVPATVLTAMIQHDQALKSNAALASAPPTYPNQPAPAPVTPAPYPDSTTVPAPMESQPPPVVIDDSQPPPQDNVAYTYFYDSLAPYGNWVDIGGYGLCWQPTVVVSIPGWQPYCDNGNWVYSDCGWCWASGYSWGWAPFHYGRWFHHNRWGWCWAPDTVWAPAWVCWRYGGNYCGWAPLPPTACFTPGIGLTCFGHPVAFSFDFGLAATSYTFVPIGHFRDPHPSRYRLPAQNVTKIYSSTVVVNKFAQSGNNRITVTGIPVEDVAAATHTKIHPVHIRDTAAPGAARLESDGKTLSVYHPQLPQPTRGTTLVGQGVEPAPRNIPAAINPRISGAPAISHVSQPSIPDSGNRGLANQNRQQNLAPAPQAQAPATGPGGFEQQNQGVFRLETPRNSLQDERHLTPPAVPPATPVQKQPAISGNQLPQTAGPREQHSSGNPPIDRTPSTVGSEPATPAAPPRAVESHPAPQIQPPPAPQINPPASHASSSGTDSNPQRH
jgi:hypothetical protein